MSEKILLVDDDNDFRNEFIDCFNEYNILDVSDGNEALKVLKKPNDIQLVLLDVMMPGMKGTEVLRQIKKMEPELSVVMVTGNSSKDVAIEALRHHADDFIEKPIDINKTKSVIDRILSAKSGINELNACATKDKIELVKRFVKKNCFKKVRLKDTATELLYLSPKYVSRVFKEVTGMKFNDYKLEVKISKAKDLLTTTGYNINQIAEKLGYQNSESFTRIFTKITGITPTQYRRKCSHRKNSALCA